ncbi:MAG: hypothetical protein QM650_19135 [Microlunatus sp.]
MQTANVWLSEHSSERPLILRNLGEVESLRSNSLPDALATDPELFLQIAKEWTILAVRIDASAPVIRELVEARERMRAGLADLGVPVRETLRSLVGRRDAHEIIPVVKSAMNRGDLTDLDRAKLTAMLWVAENQAEYISRAYGGIILPEVTEGFSWPDCAGCCGLGCSVCGEGCLLCCVAGCVVCG